jgi:protein SCO1/2
MPTDSRSCFVTVDAARDTPEHLRTYLASFDPRIIGLTGNEAQIAEAAKGWDAHYNRIAESDGSIIIVHSAPRLPDGCG